MIQKEAKTALFILTFVNLFNYLDRYIVSALVETLKKSELALSDAQAGFLMTGFIVVYMIASPVFGVIGDKLKRTYLIAFGVLVWSVATAAGGLTNSFFALFCARAAVGIGEAAYGTIAPAILADYFPKTLRGRVYAIFYCAIPVGSALGYVIGGLVDQHFGWRAAFFVAGIPGIFLALATLKIKDPKRGQNDAPQVETKTSFKTYIQLLKNPTYRITVFGYALYTFGLGGLAFWMPSFLERVRGLTKEQASIQFGAVIVVTGFLGTFIGGWVSDWLQKKTSKAALWVTAISTLLSVPFVLISLTSSNPTLLWTGAFIGELFLFASTGPINSALMAFVGPYQRAAAMALCNLMIHVFGDVPSPPLIGWISDKSSLEYAVLIVPVSILASGIVYLRAVATAVEEK